MRLVLCGKNDAAVEALEHAVGCGDEVLAVPIAGDAGEDGWQRSLRGAARRLGVRIEQPRRVNAPEAVAALAAFHPDVLVSIQYDQILRDVLFQTLGCPCVNLHFALLPRHRGVAPMAWAILDGDAEAGVTLHHMTRDVDAGDLIARRAVPIGPDDGARDLYDKVSRAAVELFRASHPFPPALLAERVPQDARAASYHRPGDIDFGHRRIAWDRPADDLQRWVRAMIFPPMQYPETTRRGRMLAVTRIAGTPVAVRGSAVPGTVVARVPDGALVATAEGALPLRGLIDPRTGGDVLGTLAVGDRLE